MTESDRPRRRIPKHFWLYLAPTGMAFSAAISFIFQDDTAGIAALLFGMGYVFLIVLQRTGRSKPKHLILFYVFLASALLVNFGADSRRVAPVLNQVLPHVGLEVNKNWQVSLGDAAQNGMTFRLFEVTLTSRWARGVDADVYDFAFESGGARYDNTSAPKFRGCDFQTVPKNGALTCLVALELPQTTVGGTLIFGNNTYRAWADVSF